MRIGNGAVTAVLLGVLAAMSPGPTGVLAYDSPCHTHATREAGLLWNFPEMRDYMEAWVVEGSSCEDSEEHIYPSSGVCGMTPRHFWEADDGDFQQNNCVGWDYDNAWVKGRALIDRAVSFYWEWINSGTPIAVDSAYHYFGHACHLIEDMGAPCHAHVDYHDRVFSGDACYEEWMCCYHCDTRDNAPCLTWTWQNARDRWGYFVLDEATRTMAANYLGGECWEPRELQASYYYLMYTTQQYTDYFASDGYDGDTDVRPGWGVDYTGFPATPTTTGELSDNDDGDNDDDGDLTNIANFAYTRVISSLAALYTAWRDYWDDIAPSTDAVISGAAEVHDGWRPGDVSIALAASDDSHGSAVHDSGVYMLHWQAGGDAHAGTDSTDEVPVADEGSTQVCYESGDRFGNSEATHCLTIKIDKTAPEAAISSPTADGFYLSDGSFTIDFEASDVPSGVYSLSADLDGEPVTDGQVFSDLSHMAGYHTVTVIAEDYAGNTTTVSVTFSIKIHGTADINPPLLVTKSHGAAITAEIEFPPEYDAQMIDPSTGTLTVGETTVPATPTSGSTGHVGPDGLVGMLLQFDRGPICAELAGVNDIVTMEVEGRLFDSTEFYATDDVEVFSPPPEGGNQLQTSSPPSRLMLEDASPNPFSGLLTVSFAVPREGLARIDLFDVSGHFVVNVAQGSYPPGHHSVGWENVGIGTGVYFLRLSLGSETTVRKVVIAR